MRSTSVSLAIAGLVLWGGEVNAQAERQQESSTASADRKWEFEGHGGLATFSRPAGGSPTLPTTGTTVGGLISASTFYFGAGADLFNKNQTAVAASAPTIAALDPVVAGSAIRRSQSAGSAGGRLNWSLGERFAIEISGDYDRSTLMLSDQALSAIEAARASYVPALTRALAGPSSSPMVASTATLTDRQQAPQVSATAALLVKLKRTGAVIPYIIGGGGAVFNFGDTPVVTLEGKYQFGSSSMVFATDHVGLRYTVPDREYVGIGGGGVKYYATPRWGVRIDGRARIGRTRVENQVTVLPDKALESAGSPFPIIRSGALQFSSTDPLTGSALTSEKTFAGSGFQVHVAVTAGVLWRF